MVRFAVAYRTALPAQGKVLCQKSLLDTHSYGEGGSRGAKGRFALCRNRESGPTTPVPSVWPARRLCVQHRASRPSPTRNPNPRTPLRPSRATPRFRSPSPVTDGRLRKAPPGWWAGTGQNQVVRGGNRGLRAWLAMTTRLVFINQKRTEPITQRAAICRMAASIIRLTFAALAALLSGRPRLQSCHANFRRARQAVSGSVDCRRSLSPFLASSF